MYGKFLQWSRRRPGDIPSLKIIMSVVTGAPYGAKVLAVLYGAIKVSTYSRKSLDFIFIGYDNNSQLAPEFEYP